MSFWQTTEMLKLSLLITVLVHNSYQLYIEICQLGQEKCSCSYYSYTNIIQADCSLSSMEIINLLDLDKNLKISNDGQLGIELIIRNKYFYKNLFGITNRTVNYLLNPNLDLIQILTLQNNKFLDYPHHYISSFILNLKSLNKLSMYENDLLDIDSSCFNLNLNIKQLNLSSNPLKKIKNDTFASLNSLETLYLYSNEIQTLEVNSLRGLQNLKYLHLYSNKIRVLHRETFKNLKKVEQLLLNNNEIRFIEPNAFNQMENLIFFDLSFNQITEIRNETFSGLSKLEKLYLFRNKIVNIESNSFFHLKNLKELRIEFNRITSFKNNLFKNLIKLETLFIGNNLIENFDENLFSENKFLKIFECNFNKLKSLKNSSFFKNLFKLERVSLGMNQIVEIDEFTFAGLQCLKDQLNLESNRLKILPSRGFLYLKNLIVLNLAQNQIQTIEEDAFLGLENLKEIRMDSNVLKFVRNSTFSHLKSLSVMKLENNEIKFIEKFSFDSMKSTLLTLDLYSNRIQSIQKETFSNLSKLTILNLSENEIDEIESYSFGSSLKSLERLNLSFNKLQLIKADYFVNLSSLTHLDISNNRILRIDNNSFKQNLNKLNVLIVKNNYLDNYEKENFKGLENLESLELRSNHIRFLSMDCLENIGKLASLYLAHNKLKTIEAKTFGKNKYISHLDLNYNELSSLKEQAFFNLALLKELYLCGNSFTSIQQLKLNVELFANLKFIDLSENLIEFLTENDFNFGLNLNYINLNGNRIKFINNRTFINMPFMETIKISNLFTDSIDFKLFSNNPKLIEIDMSHNNINVQMNDVNKLLKNFRVINLENVRFISNHISIDRFITNKLITEINFSQNNLSHNYSMFDLLTKLEKLELRQIFLETMTVINFQNFPVLKHLDLSFNNIYQLNEVSFRNLLMLTYLDLSNNRIEIIDLNEIPNKWQILEYLNLENNRIKFIQDYLIMSRGMVTIKLSNNSFGDDFSNFEYPYYLKEIYLSKNKLSIVKNENLFDYNLKKMKILNMDSNEISFMNNNLFSNLKTLVNLSIADNQLTSINKEVLFYLFNLRYLNLSRNRIDFIEMNSFINLGKLLTLDLSFNRLYSIQNGVFNGLFDLNNLNLINNSQFLTFENQSLNSILNISNVYLDIRLIKQYKCFFMHSIERVIRRNVSNKYIFYKSINLLTLNSENDLDCELTFQFLQFKIHLNLKSDFENDQFYEICKDYLIKESNNFNSSFKLCFNSFLVEKKDLNYFQSMREFPIFITDYVFLLTLFLILSLCVPVTILICIHFYVVLCNSKAIYVKVS
jgi:insulin-like growth factor-binding protein complex acid labile subunit